MSRKQMPALVKKKAQRGLWLEEVPIPETGPNDVLIKIKKTAICGTDVHIYNWDAWAQKTIPVPMIIGHEFVGEVADFGENVKNLTLGEQVSGEGHVVCGRCRNCLAGNRHLCKSTLGVGVNRSGVFAQYLSLPAENVWPCDIQGICEDTASFYDALGNAVHTALTFDIAGEDVLITGAGPIGNMAAAICRHIGARHVVVTDVNPYRLDLASKMGATRTVDAKNEELTQVIAELGMKEGFDVGLEMSGSAQAFGDMVQAMCHGGKIAVLGIQAPDTLIDWDKVVFGGLTVKGVYGREMFETWYKMSTMLQSGLDVSGIITHRFDFQDYEKGFEAMNSGMSGKIILDWARV